MELHENTYIKTEGLLWDGVLKSVTKSQNKLQPIFEAMTNALESITIRRRENPDSLAKIAIELHYTKNLFSDEGGNGDFEKIIIKDNGVGFDDENFDRVFIYKDNRKGFNNRGSGRLQYLHYFESTQISSTYKLDANYFQRNFNLSKSHSYIDNNAIIYYVGTAPSENRLLETSVVFSGILDDKDKNYYENLEVQDLKEIILNRYMMTLCSQRNNLPEIKIEKYLRQRRVYQYSLFKNLSRLKTY